MFTQLRSLTCLTLNKTKNKKQTKLENKLKVKLKLNNKEQTKLKLNNTKQQCEFNNKHALINNTCTTVKYYNKRYNTSTLIVNVFQEEEL